MRYIIPPVFYLYNILTGGENFENILEQQVFMAEHGIDWNKTDEFIDIEREIVIGILSKKAKEKAEQRSAEWSVFAQLFNR